MSIVALTAPAGPVGRHLAAALRQAHQVHEVEPRQLPSHLQADLAGAVAVVDIGLEQGDPRGATRRLLAAASAAGIDAVVHISTAAVYGAWPGNAVPLGEDAALRPNPGFEWVAAVAESERLVAEWRDERPSRRAAVLRPALVVGPTCGTGQPQALTGSAVVRGAQGGPPAQFTHEDDLASAVLVALDQDLDGAFNVAPDGWLADDQVRALIGQPAGLALPRRAARLVVGVVRRARPRRLPPGSLPYLVHPWVVANDRLRGTGWTPRQTNAEAFVAGHPPVAWNELSPKRRQELALGGLAAGAAVAVGTAVVLVGRARKRASS